MTYGRYLLITAAIACAAPAHASMFLNAIEDVPLAPGLVEAAGPVVFESHYGRVIRTSASGDADYAATRDFYIATLPALGWKREGETLKFARESERLAIVLQPASGTGSPLNVTFELVVKLASSSLPE